MNYFQGKRIRVDDTKYKLLNFRVKKEKVKKADYDRKMTNTQKEVNNVEYTVVKDYWWPKYLRSLSLDESNLCKDIKKGTT